MSRFRPTRTHLLLGLVVVLLATVPVLVPLVVTTVSVAPRTDALRLAASPGVPALPRAGGEGTPVAAATATPPPRAGTLAPAPASPTTPAPTTSASTSAATTADPPPSPKSPAPSPAPSPTDTATVFAAGPNLVVVSVSWSPRQPRTGDAVLFSAVVRNAGTDPTPALTHGVAFSVDGTEVTWSDTSTAPLAAGEERKYTADGGVAGSSWIAVAGEHTLQAYADDADRIPEVNETDNTATTTLTVR